MPNRILRDWTDSETMNATTDTEEAFFTRLLMAVDDFGRYTADPRLLLARLYPLRIGKTDAKHVLRIRDALAQHTLIVLYVVDGKEFLQVANWQNVPRAKHSKFPECTADAQQMHSTCTASAPVTVTVTEDRKPITEHCPISSDVARIWAAYPDKTGKAKASDCIEKDLRSGHTADEILAGVERYKESVESKRANGFKELKWKNGSTFFYQREWLSEHTVEPASTMQPQFDHPQFMGDDDEADDARYAAAQAVIAEQKRMNAR